MKKILFLLMLIAGICNSNAQTSDDIFTFKGIPIKGSVSEFSKKLQQQGFRIYDGEKILSGKFMDQNVFVLLNQDQNEPSDITNVLVQFIGNGEGGNDITLYLKIRSLLEKKYNDSNKWAIEDMMDMKEYPNIETVKAIRQGKYSYTYRIFNTNINRVSYITLTWINKGIFLVYFNPYTIEKIERRKDQQSMSDL